MAALCGAISSKIKWSRDDCATAQLIARLEADGQHGFCFTANQGMVPELPSVRLEDRVIRGRKRGVFTEYTLPKPAMPKDRTEAASFNKRRCCEWILG